MSDSSPAVRKRKWDDDESAGGAKLVKTEDGVTTVKTEDAVANGGLSLGNGTPTSATDQAMQAAARIAAQVGSALRFFRKIIASLTMRRGACSMRRVQTLRGQETSQTRMKAPSSRISTLMIAGIDIFSPEAPHRMKCVS